MAYRFWRRMKVAPGITLNLSKGGPSVSFGPRGAKFTVGARGARATAGIPGTGLFYTKQMRPHSGRRRSGRSSGGRSGEGGYGPPPVPPERRLTLSFFQKLFTPEYEKNFVDGCREWVLGEKDKALDFLARSLDVADAAYLAGLIEIKKNELDKALEYLSRVEKNIAGLGDYFDKYGVAPEIYVHITDEIGTYIDADKRGLLLLLVELYQEMGKLEEARKRSEKLLRMLPDDGAVKLSHAEILLAIAPDDVANLKEILELTEGVENDSPVHTALLYYRAKALRDLKLSSAAKDLLTRLVRRKKDRPKELMCALYYERAAVYEELGQKKRARSDLERVFAIDPEYGDVGERLGIGG